MSKVISDPTTRSGMPKNYIVDTKIVNLLMFIIPIYCMTTDKCDPSVHNESHVGKIQYGVDGTIG